MIDKTKLKTNKEMIEVYDNAKISEKIINEYLHNILAELEYVAKQGGDSVIITFEIPLYSKEAGIIGETLDDLGYTFRWKTDYRGIEVSIHF